MLLAFDTSSSACTAALFDGSGICVARRDEIIGRGHAERLVPMIAELLDGRSADRILLIEGGRIIEDGTHHDLIRRRGHYFELYTNQFTSEKESELLESDEEPTVAR